ncbi:Beta-carbonic anhydrase 1 [Sporomusa aerivorans]
MMNMLEQILAANKQFVANLMIKSMDVSSGSGKLPSRELAIFTCMDTRLVEFLEPAMGISRGQAKVIKNAGNTITGPFEATIRSLVIGIFELGVKEIMVIGHLDCGVATTDSKKLIQKMLARGISADAIKMIEKELEQWIDHFHHPLENVEEAVLKIRSNPLIPKDVPVHGLMFNPHTGDLSIVVNGYGHTRD